MMILLRPLVLLILCCQFAAAAWADPRFVVELDRATAAPTLNEQIQQALPQLWNRILPLNNPVGMPLVSDPQSVLSRVQNSRESIVLELNEQVIMALLQQQGIPVLRRTPHIRLNIVLLNVAGKAMVNSQRLLAQEAADLARQWGLALDPNASEVNMTFSWLSEQEVALQISGSALLSDIHENRTLHGDSFIFLKAWLRDDLLQLRDTLAADRIVTPVAAAPSPPPVAALSDDESGDTYSSVGNDDPYAISDASPTAELPIDGILLMIRKSMSLSQQLLFEEAMRKEQRVISLTPVTLSSDELRYALKLKSDDPVWLQSWFEQHGMRATRLDQGWLIH